VVAVPTLNRREALATGAGALAVAGFGWPAGQAAAANDYAERILRFTGGKTPVEARIKLDLPEIAENGNTVPLTVKVESAGGSDARVEEILILAPKNPNAPVVLLRFSAMSVPEASTRIRLAETESVIAVAKMNDGTFFSGAKEIKVTIGGCGG
jgi:sulfur-oxidizing protein SoxY